MSFIKQAKAAQQTITKQAKAASFSFINDNFLLQDGSEFLLQEGSNFIISSIQQDNWSKIAKAT